jgi:glc operon protein GlcG
MQNTSTLDHHDALRATEAIVAALKAKGQAAVLAIVDSHGELIGFLRMAGAPLPSINIALNKAFTAARNQGPSGDLGRAARDPAKGFDIRYLGDSRFIGWDGGLPVRVAGKVVGAIGVSGLTGEEDVAYAEIGIAAIVSAL